MANLFNSIRVKKPNKNIFDLTHDHKLSLNAGELVPVMVQECVPGDRFTIGHESLIKMAPMVAPPMSRIHATIHTFFVPNRILWSNWEKFITNTKEGDTLPAFPFMDYATYSRLGDYMGLPNPPAVPVPGSNNYVNILPFLAYNKIWNEYYRDQNLMEPVIDTADDGVNMPIFTLLKRSWEHDYFTSALPFAQKGDAVSLPLGDVTLKEEWPVGAEPVFRDNDGDVIIGAVNNATGGQSGIHIGAGTDDMAYDPDGTLEVTPTTVNDLRRAMKLQEFFEKAARAGSRYAEYLRGIFAVNSSDKRLQRPEYITGTKTPIVISEVVNTTGTTERPQGDMAGHGLGVMNGGGGSYFCEEHGFIISIMSIMPEPAYWQGYPKHFLKISDPFQYYLPDFANIGEQEVLNKEIYAFQGDTIDNGIFGYVPRYAEYKFTPNRVSGDFKTTLDFWHWGRKFATPPQLNQAFIECNPDHRIFAVEDADVQKFYCHVLNKIRAVRPMPKYGTPSF